MGVKNCMAKRLQSSLTQHNPIIRETAEDGSGGILLNNVAAFHEKTDAKLMGWTICSTGLDVSTQTRDSVWLFSFSASGIPAYIRNCLSFSPVSI